MKQKIVSEVVKLFTYCGHTIQYKELTVQSLSIENRLKYMNLKKMSALDVVVTAGLNTEANCATPLVLQVFDLTLKLGMDLDYIIESMKEHILKKYVGTGYKHPLKAYKPMMPEKKRYIDLKV